MYETLEEQKKKCTIVVSSCDAYEELWTPFFTLLKMQWPNMPFSVVLNTESKVYHDSELDVKCMELFQAGSNVSWGKRLRETLKRVDTEYIIFMLDDFFVDGKIDEKIIMDCIKWMEADRNISVFSFMETFTDNYDDGKYPGFNRRKLFGEYRFNCQAALWRRKHLIQYLRDYESAWDWEVYGNWRSYRYINRKFYSKKAEADSIIPYLFDVGGRNFGGLVLFRGRWYLPLVKYFEEKYRLGIDWNTRGVMEEEELLNIIHPVELEKERPVWKQKMAFLRPIYHKYLYVKNIIVHMKHIF